MQSRLHGSYEALEGGQTMDAMVDLTGGMAERYEMKKVRGEKLHDIIARAIKARNAFICCSKEGTYEGHGRSRSSNGLIGGHAYSLTAALKVKRPLFLPLFLG